MGIHKGIWDLGLRGFWVIVSIIQVLGKYVIIRFSVEGSYWLLLGNRGMDPHLGPEITSKNTIANFLFQSVIAHEHP